MPNSNTHPWLQQRLEWFQDMKFGFFVHWGIYSQWGCIESWPLVEVDTWARPDDLAPWVGRAKDMERFKRDYFRLNETFNPVRFNPEVWAEAAQHAGMKYFVFTTKHHDGFSMFDTQQTDFRITAPSCPYSQQEQPDVARRLFDVFRAKGFAIGAYFSKSDWRCPYYWWPAAPARTRNPNYDTHQEPERWAKFVEFVHEQIKELMTGYGKIDILWLDGGQVRPPNQDIQMDRLVTMARAHQPQLIVVDRTVGGEHENYLTPEQEVPDDPLDYVWESCITMGRQWSYKPDDEYKSTHSLIHLLIDIVAKGGNLLLNVGPQPDGQLPATALSRMQEIGDWMQINGDAIYGTRPIAPYKRGKLAFTRKGESIYAIFLAEQGESLPAQIDLPRFPIRRGAAIRLLGSNTPTSYQIHDEGISFNTRSLTLSGLPDQPAYVFEIPVESGNV